MHQIIVDRERVGQDAVGRLLADVEAVAGVLDCEYGDLVKQKGVKSESQIFREIIKDRQTIIKLE